MMSDDELWLLMSSRFLAPHGICWFATGGVKSANGFNTFDLRPGLPAVLLNDMQRRHAALIGQCQMTSGCMCCYCFLVALLVLLGSGYTAVQYLSFGAT